MKKSNTLEKADNKAVVISVPRGIIKVCPDPTCEEVAHNCEKKATYCNNCGHRVMEINEKTYLKKFVRNPFQYDHILNKKVFPEDLGYDPGYTQSEIEEMKEMRELFDLLKTPSNHS